MNTDGEPFKPRKHKYDARPLEKNIEAAMMRAMKKVPFVVLFRKNAVGFKYAARDFPDRTVFGLYGFTMHVEVKREGEKLSPGQEKMVAMLREAGHIVKVCDNVKSLIDEVTTEYATWPRKHHLKPSSIAASPRSSRVNIKGSASITGSKNPP